MNNYMPTNQTTWVKWINSWKHSLPKLNQEELENLSRPFTTNKFEAVIKKFPANKSPGSDGFISEFYEAVKELTPILLKLFQKIQEEGRLPSSFYEVDIILILKPDDTTRKNYRPISLINTDAKILNKISNVAIHYKDYIP